MTVMAAASIKVEFPRRQAMLSLVHSASQWSREAGYPYREVARVPVFVWPMPTREGLFIVEHQDGHCHTVQPHELTFLGSKELFDQYDWSES